MSDPRRHIKYVGPDQAMVPGQFYEFLGGLGHQDAKFIPPTLEEALAGFSGHVDTGDRPMWVRVMVDGEMRWVPVTDFAWSPTPMPSSHDDPIMEVHAMKDVGPKSLAGRLLVPDFVPDGGIPKYDKDARSKVVSAPGCQVITYGDEVLLPWIPCPKDPAEEEAMVSSLLMASVEPRNTVCSEGGLTRTSVLLAFQALEDVWEKCAPRPDGERLVASSMLANPSMLPHFQLLFGLDDDRSRLLGDAFGRGEAASVTFRSYPYGPLQEFDEATSSFIQRGGVRQAPERTISIIPCPSVPIGVVLVTAQPHFVGAYAFAPDGRVAMAVLNDYGVARINIKVEARALA